MAPRARGKEVLARAQGLPVWGIGAEFAPGASCVEGSGMLVEAFGCFLGGVVEESGFLGDSVRGWPSWAGVGDDR